MYKEDWRIHGGSRTSICLQNYARGPNRWCIGIRIPIALLKDADSRQRYEKLREHLNTSVAITTSRSWDQWPWWIWVDNKYQNWDSIIPALNEECNVRCDITNYFVDKLVKITNAATRIIDEIEAPSDSPSSSSQ